MDKIRASWNKILDYLLTYYQIEDSVFETWLAPLVDIEVCGSVLYILVNTKEKADYLQDNFRCELEVSVRAVMNEDYRIRFVQQDIKGLNLGYNLIEKFRFDTFLTSKTNEFAYSVARTIVEHPGKEYNPFYLYGESGVGKTHILHAIANEVLQRYPDKKVLYTTCENFISELICAVCVEDIDSDFSMHAFRKKNRDADVLLLDDIQFLIGREAAQEEFFDMLNDAYMHGTHIVISCDKPLERLTILNSCIRARLESGIVVRMDFPDFKTRKDILKQKVQEFHYEQYDISDDIIAYIAEHTTSNVGSLEGALHRVAVDCQLSGKCAKIDFVKEIKTIFLGSADEEIII